MSAARKEHQEYQQSIKTGVCSKCRESFLGGLLGARSHMRMKHCNYPCQGCTKPFFLQEAVNQHMSAKNHHTAGVRSGASVYSPLSISPTRASVYSPFSTNPTTPGGGASDSWHVGVLDGSRPGETLDDFMKRKVFPDEEY